jgi:adenylate kinase
MKVYEDQTSPLIAYYRKRGILAEVDGVGEIEEVAARVRAAIGAR